MLRRLSSLGISLSYATFSRLLRGGPHGCVVLYYHGVSREQAPRFRRQMEWLVSNCSVIPLRALLRGDFDGHRCACVTFDDALDNVREHALPVLQQLNIPASMFAVPGNLGRKPSWAMAEGHPDRLESLSTEEQLRQYPTGLVEIGSHTMTHPDLAGLKGECLDYELVESKRALEDLLGYEVLSLSVPFGSYNEETLQAARRAGYKIVVTCDPVCFAMGDSPLRVGRFKVTPNDWGIELKLKAKGAHAWRRSWHRLKNPRQTAPVTPVTDSLALPQEMELSK